MGELEFVAVVEFSTSNESVMVLGVAKKADFSDKFATNESVRSIFDASILPQQAGYVFNADKIFRNTRLFHVILLFVCSSVYQYLKYVLLFIFFFFSEIVFKNLFQSTFGCLNCPLHVVVKYTRSLQMLCDYGKHYKKFLLFVAFNNVADVVAAAAQKKREEKKNTVSAKRK